MKQFYEVFGLIWVYAVPNILYTPSSKCSLHWVKKNIQCHCRCTQHPQLKKEDWEHRAEICEKDNMWQDCFQPTKFCWTLSSSWLPQQKQPQVIYHHNITYRDTNCSQQHSSLIDLQYSYLIIKNYSPLNLNAGLQNHKLNCLYPSTP